MNFEEKTINQEEIKNFDFFLLPTTYFKQLKIKQVDLITNFFSFGEMKEDQLAEYLNSEIFINSKIIFLSNRVFSNPNKTLYNEEDYDEKNSTYYDCNTTINDYHLHKYSKVFFDKNPVYPYLIKNKKILFLKK